MSDDRCEHLMLIGQCALCKPPPQGVLPHGYSTKGGQAYHNDPNCDWLRRGQAGSYNQGKNIHAVERIAWGNVQPGKLEPCEVCCTPQWLTRHGKTPPTSTPPGKACEVRNGDEWFAGTLVWEKTARHDGLWWAKVRYLQGSTEFVAVKNQHDLRQRP